MNASLRERLERGLEGAYAIKRELGGGGMSRVFVAQDTTLGRSVAVKVLPPEMAIDISTERFRREIQLAAQLQHPHIVPLLSAGEADGLLYYTMPFVQGESLRALLDRGGQLPVGTTLRLLREVADALSYAHARGVIHRDIKPENVLLTTNHAVVADFGIAKALTASTRDSTITAAGLALGTPAYMAPEQAAGELRVDHRADLYALGALAYELLTGRPPFHDLPLPQLLAAHATCAPDPVSKYRTATPPALEALIMRLLAKNPADRPESATEVLASLDSITVPAAIDAPPSPTRFSLRRTPGGVAAAGLLLILIVAAALLFARRGGESAALDPQLMIVAPFRVSGDAELAYLREGMLDLLAAKFTGEGGPRASDPRTVLSAWRRRATQNAADPVQAEALAMARDLGGSQLLLGSVVGSSRRITLTATLLETPSGRSRGNATVEGPVDSLGALVDRLAALLLTRGAGESERLGGSLASITLPVLRSYLDGRAAYRQGRYEDAARAFETALREDTTFVHAALELLQAANWATISDGQLMLRVLARERHRLDRRDRGYLDAIRSRDLRLAVPIARQIEAWQYAVEYAADRPEPWYELGDMYFHFGALMGVSDWRARARGAFSRSIELDSAFAAPLAHLLELSMLDKDDHQTREIWRLYSSRVTEADLTDLLRWRVAVALHDTVELRQVRSSVPQMSMGSLARIAGGMMIDGVGLNDAPAVTRALLDRAGSHVQVAGAVRTAYAYYANSGKLRSARRLVAEMGPFIPSWAELPEDTGPLVRVPAAALPGWTIFNALYWDGDAEDARQVLPALEKAALSTLQDSSALVSFWSACALAHWHSHRGDAEFAARLVDIMRGASQMPLARAVGGDLRICPLTVEAIIEHGGGTGERIALDRLEAALRDGSLLVDEANLVAARLHESRGDIDAALRAIRRRSNHWRTGPVYLSTYLREEGRLASLAGDRDGAIRAYRHYLVLRTDPDPELQSDMEGVRGELARLEADSG